MLIDLLPDAVRDALLLHRSIIITLGFGVPVVLFGLLPILGLFVFHNFRREMKRNEAMFNEKLQALEDGLRQPVDSRPIITGAGCTFAGNSSGDPMDHTSGSVCKHSRFQLLGILVLGVSIGLLVSLICIAIDLSRYSPCVDVITG